MLGCSRRKLIMDKYVDVEWKKHRVYCDFEISFKFYGLSLHIMNLEVLLLRCHRFEWIYGDWKVWKEEWGEDASSIFKLVWLEWKLHFASKKTNIFHVSGVSVAHLLSSSKIFNCLFRFAISRWLVLTRSYRAFLHRLSLCSKPWYKA